MTGFDRLRALFNDASDLFLSAIFVAACSLPFLPGLQRRWVYAAAGIGAATLLGLAARRFGVPDGVDIIAVMVGFAAGPATLAKLQGKTVFEVAEEILAARRTGHRPDVGEGGDDA
jgi:hypothetical protein